MNNFADLYILNKMRKKKWNSTSTNFIANFGFKDLRLLFPSMELTKSAKLKLL